MLNIFLTGEVGVGKSTVIDKILALLPQTVCGGFRTVSDIPITDGSMLDVFIERAWKQTPHDGAHLVGSRFGRGSMVSYPERFDCAGCAILGETPLNAELVLMDELGIMESGALRFQRAVMGALDGSLPVLGVIKPKHSAFLDAIRSHERSAVFEVSMKNRDELPLRLSELLRQ